MIEKRKKLSNYSEEEHVHVDDVEEYEVKKSTFRHQWGYFVIGILVLIIIYVQYQSTVRPSPQVTKSYKLQLEADINRSELVKQIIPSYQLETASLAQTEKKFKAESTPALPEAAKIAIDHGSAQKEQQNLRKAAAVARDVGSSEAELQAKVDAQIAKIRHMKFQDHVVMETSNEAKAEIAILQDMLRSLIKMQYGPGPYRVEMKVLFPQSMSQPVLPQEQSLFIDLAPIYLVPYSVYNFLQIIKNFKV
jgi:hypothetical protein